MPRPPVIPHEDLKRAIFQTDGVIDNQGRISGPTRNCWLLISKIFQGKISSKYIYQYVHENRFNCYNELRKRKGMSSPPHTKCKTPEYNVSCSDDLFSTNESSSSSETHIFAEKTFHVLIPHDLWCKMKPVTKTYDRKERACTRYREVLPPFIWQPLLIDLLWDQHKIPCAYTFKGSYVYLNTENTEQYIHIKGHCKECNGTATGQILQKPNEGEDVPLIWRATDSRKLRHKKKRPLMADKRAHVATELCHKSVSVYRRIQAKNTMDQGDQEPPNLHTAAVLRKAKQEKQQSDNMKVPNEHRDVVELLVMKYRYPYAGSIHDVGFDKFFIHYHTPAQLLVYKAHAKTSYSVLSIDATGSLVRKIPRIHGHSGNIFLYEAVINTGLVQMPVFQMLSEKHDGNSILYWINEFLRNGGCAPDEVVVDNSGALISGITRSFCKCLDLNDYLNKCFSTLLGNETCIPSCYLRLDVAHFLNAVGKWDVWHENSMARLKDFYLRCIGLLIQCDNLHMFESIFKHVLILCLSPNEGKDENGDNVPMELSLNILSKHIKDFKNLDILGQEKLDHEGDVKSLNTNTEEELDGIPSTNISKLKEWLCNVERTTKDSIESVQNGRLNPYYAPMVAKEILRIGEKFPLWSAVMVKPFHSPHLTASSASVESDFADIKKNILKGEHKPLSIPKFISLHIDAVEGSCRIVGANENDNCKTIPIGRKRLLDKSLSKEECESKINVEPLSIDEPDTVFINQVIDFGFPEHAVTEEEITGEFIKENVTTDCIGEASCGKVLISQNIPGVKESINDLNLVENWRGLGVEKIKKQSRYLNPFPELDAAIQADLLKQPKRILLKNGNLSKLVKINREYSVLLRNTCAFDALVHVIATAYVMYDSYRIFINSSKNMLLKTAKSLATVGANNETYFLRSLALTEVFQHKLSLVMPQGLPKKNSKQHTIKEYDCTTNAPSLARKLLSDIPSITLNKMHCTDDKCARPESTEISVVDTNMNILLEKGVSCMNEAVQLSLELHQMESEDNFTGSQSKFKLIPCKPPCKGMTTMQFEMGEHLLIDIDYLSEPVVPVKDVERPFNRPQKLAEFPVWLNLYGQKCIITGVIAHTPGHYIGYTKNINGTWNVYNDLAKKVTRVTDDKVVRAHLLFYVKLQHQ